MDCQAPSRLASMRPRQTQCHACVCAVPGLCWLFRVGTRAHGQVESIPRIDRRRRHPNLETKRTCPSTAIWVHVLSIGRPEEKKKRKRRRRARIVTFILGSKQARHDTTTSHIHPIHQPTAYKNTVSNIVPHPPFSFGAKGKARRPTPSALRPQKNKQTLERMSSYNECCPTLW